MTKKEKLEAEIAATVAELPQTLDYKSALKTITERKLLDDECLVFSVKYITNDDTKKSERKAEVHCTACGGAFVADYVKEHTACGRYGSHDHETFKINIPGTDVYKESYENTFCPLCFKEAKVLHTSHVYGDTYRVAFSRVYSIHNVRNHLCILSWHATKNVDRNGNVTYSFDKEEGALLVGRKFVRVTGIYHGFGASYSLLRRWEARKRFDDRLGNMPAHKILHFDPEDIYKTEAANAAIEQYIITNTLASRDTLLLAYIRLWIKFKSLENLSVQGFGRIVAEALQKSNHFNGYSQGASNATENFCKFIDVKQVKPHRMLGIEKGELARAKRWSLDTLLLYKAAKRISGLKLTPEQIKQLSLMQTSVNQFESFFEHDDHHGHKPSVVRTINYLYRERQNAEIEKSLITLQYLTDYWNALHKVNGNMDPALLYPKNLIKAHDDMNDKVREKANLELDINIRKYSQENEHLSFSDEETGLTIFPAPSHQALIDEGKALHHCVATYAKSVSEGKTLILFIRRSADPDTPYFTLEYRNGIVAQNRGNKNCARTGEVKIFEEKWLKHIKEGKKNGKRNSKVQQHAVA